MLTTKVIRKSSGFSSEDIQKSLRDDIRGMKHTASHARHIMTTPGKKVRQLPGERINLMRRLTLNEVK